MLNWKITKAEDIYTAAVREYLCRNGYLHGCRESAETLFTRQPCVHIKYLFTRQPLKCQIGCIHGCRICFQKRLFARQPFKSNFGNIHVCRGLFCWLGVPMSKWLFTRPPCVHIKYLFTRQPLKCKIGCIHGCRICFQKWLFARQPFKSNFGNIQRIYTRLQAGSAYVEMVIYTAAGNQQKTLFTRQPCVHIKYLFLKCQIGCIHGCRICFQKRLFARQPFKNNFGNIHVCRGLFCGLGVPMSKWLFTQPPSKSQIGYFHYYRELAKIVIYTAAVCPH